MKGIFRVLALSLATLVILAVVLALSALLYLRHATYAQLPQVDGEAHTRAVRGAVTVLRDDHGVPTIQAANLDDLLAAQGYVTASDRLWQMDMIRRMTAGEAAEILGPSLLEHDRAQRVLGLRTVAERIARSQPERDQRFFADYARGVNAYIAENRGRLPAEFRLLMYQPRPWQPADSVLVALAMVQTLDQQWPTKLVRERVTAHLGSALAGDLYPTGSWRDHPPTETLPDLSHAPPTPRIPLDSSQSSLSGSAHDLLTLLQTTSPVCRSCQPGSNEWVISGAHTASGRPLLANDMHLQHQIPSLWYTAGLQAGEFHAAGVTIPGLPFVVAGHNAHVAWGFTALYGDAQDIYSERVDGHGHYWNGTGWQPFERRTEVIHVRFRPDVTLPCLSTAQGPLLNPLLPHETRTLALRWTGYDPEAKSIPLYDLDAAANWSEFQHALSQWWAPTQNVVYADDAGHIGYQAVGWIPIREGGLTATPVPEGTHAWRAVIPFPELPSAFDPPGGILATANSRTTPDNYPYPVSLEWVAPYRNERIWKWLAGKDHLTRADMLTLQTDIYSEVDKELAQRFAYAIDHVHAPSAQLRQAADLLRSWDGVLAVNSPAAAVLRAGKEAFWPLVLRPKLGDDWRLYTWPESAFVQEQLITERPAQWLPAGHASWNELLAAAVADGLRAAAAPEEIGHWQYGTGHTVDLQHPLFAHLPLSWLLLGKTGSGRWPLSGDGTTVKQVGRDFGPSQRFTMDWSDPDASTENIVMGEAGSPASPWYGDQFAAWYAGRSFPLRFSEAAVRAATQHTLSLLP